MGPEDAIHESIHILLPPHELGSTGIYANSIVHSPNGRFVNVVRIYTAFAWRNKALDVCAERGGKLKLRPTETSGKKDDTLSETGALLNVKLICYLVPGHPNDSHLISPIGDM